MQYRSDNPCDRFTPALGRQQKLVRHCRRCPMPRSPPPSGRCRASKATRVVKLAFEFLVLTAARSSEVRLATWGEMDIGARVWTIPAARMKAAREHRVPLCSRAVEILEQTRRPRADSTRVAPARLVFPSWRGKPIHDATLSGLVKELGIVAVHRSGAARFPLVVPGLGVGADGPPAGGDPSGAGARGTEPDRGGVRALHPVRAAPPTDGRLASLSGRTRDRRNAILTHERGRTWPRGDSRRATVLDPARSRNTPGTEHVDGLSDRRRFLRSARGAQPLPSSACFTSVDAGPPSADAQASCTNRRTPAYDPPLVGVASTASCVPVRCLRTLRL